MSIETANAARFEKGLTVLTPLEGELLEALEECLAKSSIVSHMIAGEKSTIDKAHEAIAKTHGETP